MSSITFHDTLNNWAQANNLNALANKIEGLKEPLVSYSNSKVAEQVNAKVKKFVDDNPKSFSAIDLPALMKIKSLLLKGKYKAGPKQKKHRTELIQIIETAIKLTNDKSDIQILPPDLMSLCGQYSSMNECINLFLAGATSSMNLFNSINKANLNEIADFVHEAKEKHTSHPHIFKKMIEVFFQHASSKTQNLFFSCLTPFFSTPTLADPFFNDFIAVLPTNITKLNLINYPFLKNHHLRFIVKRLNNLNILKINRYNNLSQFESTIKIIMKIPRLQKLTLDEFRFNTKGLKMISKKASLKSLSITAVHAADSISYLHAIPIIAMMTNLQSLNLNHFYLDNQTASQIAGMANLKSLNLKGCPFTYQFIPQIVRMTHLQSLNLSQNSICENTLLLVAGMINLKKLYLSNCFLDENGFKIAVNNMPHLKILNLSDNNELNDEAVMEITKDPNESGLQSLNLMNCKLLTGKGAMMLVNHLKNLIELNLQGCDRVDRETAEAIQEMLKNRQGRLGFAMELKSP